MTENGMEMLKPYCKRMSPMQRPHHQHDRNSRVEDAVIFVLKFIHFECVAALQFWCGDKWILLEVIALVGGAQEDFSALDLLQLYNYHIKETVYNVY